MSAQRYPAKIRIMGVMQKESVKMFIASVLWSDHGEVIIYRSYQDFKKFHKQLKKKFPREKSFPRGERILPTFRGVKTSFQKKGPSKMARRSKLLEKYCTELLQCDPNVIQSSEVIQFFLPKEHDLQPEFARNSIMVLLSDDVAETPAAWNPHEKRFSVGNVTQPFVTKTYRTVAPYETKDTKNRPFKVGVEERLDVLIKDQAGWWLVENEAKRLAWFPAPYLEVCEEEEEDGVDATVAACSLYCAVKNYASRKDDEVSVNIGAVVEVLQKSDDGWWLIRYDGRAGYIPSMYLQPYNSPYVGLQMLHGQVYRSTLNLSTAVATPSMAAEKMKSRSLETLLEPRRGPDPDLGESRESGLSSESSSEAEFSFTSSGSNSPTFSLSGKGEEAELRGSGQPKLGAERNESPERGCRALPKVPPRPQAQEILTRCTTYTRKVAMETRAKLLPRGMEIPAC
ncbi:NADPH oxidase organizer 1-like [Denticeps clupeoides]|uniref:NADPH oxidase organizer 1 n=1 Tax=Denticeps clupeoides TaxID=299321 RepID=A0AAY4BYS1_9TELE|nr:NADPH oxidase organizer 1-like [Denticeps clupeoides]